MADSLLFFGGFGFFVIGVHQSLVFTIAHAYGLFMVSLVLLFLYGYRKKKEAMNKKDHRRLKRRNRKK